MAHAEAPPQPLDEISMYLKVGQATGGDGATSSDGNGHTIATRVSV